MARTFPSLMLVLLLAYAFDYNGAVCSVHKVPATEMEALATSLMGFFQKRKFRNALVHIAKHDYADPKTWDGEPRYPCLRGRATVIFSSPWDGVVAFGRAPLPVCAVAITCACALSLRCRHGPPPHHCARVLRALWLGLVLR